VFVKLDEILKGTEDKIEKFGRVTRLERINHREHREI
jgi:hypothetical protein